MFKEGALGRADTADRRGTITWTISVLLLALALGLLLPFAVEGGLEFYAIVLTIIILAGVFTMPRRLGFRDDGCWLLFLIALALFAIYPAYISIQISGLPWISPLRLAMAVLLFVWLYALRNSYEMQDRIGKAIRENRIFFLLLAAFVASQVLSIPTSRNPSQALQKFLLFQFYWTFPFFAVLTLVRTEQRLRLLPILFIVFAVIQCLVGFQEARQERLLWLDYLPPGFGADSEVLTRILQGTFRAEGYRVQGSFSVSLVYAEFLVLMLPFALFAFVDGENRTFRIVGLVTAILIMPAQFLSGSRLGMVGSITVFLVLGCLYVFKIWRQNKRSMLGPGLLLMLPFALAIFGAVFASSPRLRALTIGGGEHQASTDSRFEMWVSGIPKIFERPLFGHGSGLGAEILGFTNLAGVLTIDSYWLGALLEFGLIGAFALIGLVVWGIWHGIAAYLSPKSGVKQLGGPIAVSLIAFMIIKLVLSQADVHMLIFILLAMVLVLKSDAIGFGETSKVVPTGPRPPSRYKPVLRSGKLNSGDAPKKHYGAYRLPRPTDVASPMSRQNKTSIKR